MFKLKTYVTLGVVISIVFLAAFIFFKDNSLKPDTTKVIMEAVNHEEVKSDNNIDSSSSEKSVEKLSENISSMTTEWDKTRDNIALDYESIQSWIPESGIRGRYQIAKKVMSVAILESIVGEKVFLNKTHQQGISYTNATEFGHYNPDFLLKLHKILTQIFNNKVLVANIQPFYNNELKQYLRTFFLSYQPAANNQAVIDGYLSIIDKTKPSSNTDSSLISQGSSSKITPSLFLQESFRDFSNSLEKQGYDVYEAFVCPGFWVRRSIDSTEDEFFQLLKLMINTFDADFLKKQ